jgi:hypothetical protein
MEQGRVLDFFAVDHCSIARASAAEYMPPCTGRGTTNWSRSGNLRSQWCRLVADMADDGGNAHEQQAAEIPLSLLRDPAEADPVVTEVLLRHEPEPGRELLAGPELAGPGSRSPQSWSPWRNFLYLHRPIRRPPAAGLQSASMCTRLAPAT